MRLSSIHHVAIICSDYARSRHFYTQVLGLRVLAEVYRDARRSHKLDLALPDGGQLELFSFPDPPPRPSYPEACGLRHLAFAVDDIDACVSELQGHGIAVEAVRVDEYTGRRYTFFADPDDLPIEFYERG
ncbi:MULTISPECIES: VOC family protein [unclassified Lysobacter]|uniref:SMU1112c/YaeR family gloxylase I-like metalloprotein n=1 Tax=unclassified Lysobacter TaxID=2635362 RepID=UPI001BE77D99|nr:MULTISPECIES: VOC family protein [unclassified Lysobacter]MBT2747322.1 VOC family protein [Lysobacter sp. ISL-42]MBT2752246.1 VOC family protein [Lysobacter sp. ISL-50]MBT2778986.1 VOC family protein [Lysobacter sp. ISL-54]MBT2783628.1 VOC family protein [Lysobacter sp. ISL-52]